MIEPKHFVPVPDPTLLTTAALKLSIDNLKELLEEKIASQERLLNEKIIHNFMMDEKRHRETREWLEKLEEHRVEEKVDSEKALAVALESRTALLDQQRNCNEETARMISQYTARQIDSLSKEASTSRQVLNDRISELKERLDRGTGKEHQQGIQRDQQGWFIPMIVLAALYMLNLIFNVIQFVPHILNK